MTWVTSFIAISFLLQSSFAANQEPQEQTSGDVVYTIGRGISPPGVLYKPEPSYSEEARRKGIEGKIQLLVTVKTDGSVGDVKIKRSLGPGLDEQAITTIRTWRFTPAMKDGVPVAVQVTVEVQFQLYKGLSPFAQPPPPEDVPPKLLDTMPGDVRGPNTVKVALIVREDGSVDPKSIKFESKVDGRIKEVVSRLVQKLRFAPGTHFGVPTKAKMQLELDIDSLMSASTASKQ
jgi:TonB family protein